MTARSGLLVGALAIAAGIAWFAFGRGGSAEERSAPGRGEGSAPLTTAASGPAATGSAARRDGRIDLSPKVRPAPGAPTEVPLPAAGTAFEAEARDPAWARATESEIKHRFATGVREGQLDSAECRQRQCLLTMSGTEAEMSTALADLETEGGLRGFADHVVLDGPVLQDGRMIVRAYAVFDRK